VSEGEGESVRENSSLNFISLYGSCGIKLYDPRCDLSATAFFRNRPTLTQAHRKHTSVSAPTTPTKPPPATAPAFCDAESATKARGGSDGKGGGPGGGGGGDSLGGGGPGEDGGGGGGRGGSGGGRGNGPLGGGDGGRGDGGGGDGEAEGGLGDADGSLGGGDGGGGDGGGTKLLRRGQSG